MFIVEQAIVIHTLEDIFKLVCFDIYGIFKAFLLNLLGRLDIIMEIEVLCKITIPHILLWICQHLSLKSIKDWRLLRN